MSIRPQRFFASATIVAIAASLVTSASKAKQSPPSLRTIVAVSSARPSSRSTAMIFAPSRAKRWQVARPLPMPLPGLWPAPTMIAVFDSSRTSGHDEQPPERKQRAPVRFRLVEPADPGAVIAFESAAFGFLQAVQELLQPGSLGEFGHRMVSLERLQVFGLPDFQGGCQSLEQPPVELRLLDGFAAQ